MHQTLSFSCSEEAKSISMLATGFNAGQRFAVCQQSPELYIKTTQENQKRLMNFQTASVCNEAEREKHAISFQRIEKMLKILKKN